MLDEETHSAVGLIWNIIRIFLHYGKTNDQSYRVSTQKQDSQPNSFMLDCTLSTKSSDQQMTGHDGQMYEVSHTSIYSGISLIR